MPGQPIEEEALLLHVEPDDVSDYKRSVSGEVGKPAAGQLVHRLSTLVEQQQQTVDRGRWANE